MTGNEERQHGVMVGAKEVSIRIAFFFFSPWLFNVLASFSTHDIPNGMVRREEMVNGEDGDTRPDGHCAGS